LIGLFPHTITIYNKYTKGLGNWTGGLPPTNSVAWDITIIKNVSWEDEVHRNQDSTGKSTIDKTISVTIPLKEMEVEGGKRYVDTNEYVSLPVDTSNVWTLQDGDIIVFGESRREISALYTITNLQRDYKTMIIKGVEDTTKQDTLPNWNVSGVQGA